MYRDDYAVERRFELRWSSFRLSGRHKRPKAAAKVRPSQVPSKSLTIGSRKITKGLRLHGLVKIDTADLGTDSTPERCVAMVEQMRTVHLAILLLCLTLLASGFVRERGPLQIAYEDAIAISEVGKRYIQLYKEIENRLTEFNAIRPANSTKGRAHPELTILLDGVPNSLIEREREGLLIDLPPDGTARKHGLVPLNQLYTGLQWKTLADFVSFWDYEPIVIVNPIYSDEWDGPRAREFMTSCGVPLAIQLLPSARNLRPALPTLFLDRKTQIVSMNLIVLGLQRPCEVTNEIQRYIRLDVDLRELIRSTAGQRRWQLARFVDTFRELDESTPFLRSLSFSDLINHLKFEADQAGEKVDIVGAKIPYSLVSILGAIVLASAQFYLWCHLLEYRSRLDGRPPDVVVEDRGGYIGLYQDAVARHFTIASVSTLPVLVEILALSRSNSIVTMWPLAVVTIIASAALGWCIRTALREVWHLMDSRRVDQAAMG